jgi:hypothetical protein
MHSKYASLDSGDTGHEREGVQRLRDLEEVAGVGVGRAPMRWQQWFGPGERGGRANRSRRQ